MPEEIKKERKKKEERTEKEQAFMTAVHDWRKKPYAEAWEEVCKLALAFKVEKTGKEDAKL